MYVFQGIPLGTLSSWLGRHWSMRHFHFYLWVSKGKIFPVYGAKKNQLSLKEAEEEEGVGNNHSSAVSLSERPNGCLLVWVEEGRRKWSMVGKKRKSSSFHIMTLDY